MFGGRQFWPGYNPPPPPKKNTYTPRLTFLIPAWVQLGLVEVCLPKGGLIRLFRPRVPPLCQKRDVFSFVEDWPVVEPVHFDQERFPPCETDSASEGQEVLSSLVAIIEHTSIAPPPPEKNPPSCGSNHFCPSSSHSGRTPKRTAHHRPSASSKTSACPVRCTSSSGPLYHSGLPCPSHGPHTPSRLRNTHSWCPASVPPSAVKR